MAGPEGSQRLLRKNEDERERDQQLRIEAAGHQEQVRWASSGSSAHDRKVQESNQEHGGVRTSTDQ